MSNYSMKTHKVRSNIHTKKESQNYLILIDLVVNYQQSDHFVLSPSSKRFRRPKKAELHRNMNNASVVSSVQHDFQRFHLQIMVPAL